MDNEKLIELVQEHSLLYNIQDKRYSDTQKKDVAWREIAKKLNTSDKECKKAWNYLRDGFRRAMKKQRESKNDQECVSTKKWRFEDKLAFLIPYLKERTINTTSKSTEGEKRDDSSSDLERSLADNAIIPQPDTPLSNLLKPIAPEIFNPTISRPRQFQKKVEPQETSLTVMMKYILNQTKVDDIDTFFSSMAATVSKFPPRQRAIAKAQVFSVISKLEMETLSQHSSQPQHQRHPATTSIYYSPGSIASNYSSDSCSSQGYGEMQVPTTNTDFSQEFALKQEVDPLQTLDYVQDCYNFSNN